MILPNMSYQEIAAHLSSDMDEAFIIGKTKSTNFQNEKYKKIAFTHF